MRIPSGVTDQFIYFVAVDSTDLKTRETGLTTFTVYRSRDGAAAAAMTTPTVNETDATNMPGVYELLLDEDTTVASGNDSEEMVFHITQASMAPVTRTIELYRRTTTAGNTLDVTATGAGGVDWGNIENKTTANDLSGTDIQLVDTTTTNTDMRGTDSAATAANLATVDTNVDAILVDTSTTLDTKLNDIQGATFSSATDSLEAVRDRGDAAWTTGAGGTPPQLLQNTTIATLASQTSFTLTAGSADDDAYNGAVVVVTDSVTSEQKAVGSVSDYTGSTKTVTLLADPAIFTMAAGDTIDIIANASTAPTAAAVADAVLDEALSGHVSAGSLGKAVADIETDSTAILADTANMQPKLGTPAGADMSADIAAVKTDTAAVLIDTNELQGDWTNGGRLDLILDAILADTGTDGVVLTAAERNSIADAILDRDMSTGTDSGSPTVRTVRQALRFSRNKVSIVGGTLTVTKEDDSTASWTAAVTTTAGDPITTVDPA